jgi:hypothetical protein
LYVLHESEVVHNTVLSAAALANDVQCSAGKTLIAIPRREYISSIWRGTPSQPILSILLTFSDPTDAIKCSKFNIDFPSDFVRRVPEMARFYWNAKLSLTLSLALPRKHNDGTALS